MSRAAVFLLSAGILVLVAGAAYWALRNEAAPEAPPPPPTTTQQEPTVSLVEPTVNPHPVAWPGQEFEAELSQLAAEARPSERTEDPMRQNELKAYPQKFTIHQQFESLEQLCELLTRELSSRGVNVKVFTYPSPVNEQPIELNVDDMRLDELCGEVLRASQGEVGYFMTSLGLTFGGIPAVQQAQMDDRVARSERLAESERNDPVVGVPFRPDFVDATVASVARVVREQTKIDVVVDFETWRDGRTLSWRADPMPLRDALSRICGKMGCTWRLKDGRIFLLRP